MFLKGIDRYDSSGSEVCINSKNFGKRRLILSIHWSVAAVSQPISGNVRDSVINIVLR